MLAAALLRACVIPRALPRASVAARAMSSAPADASSASVKTPREVLSFWFAEDAYFGDKPELMSDGEFMKTKARSLWYAGTSADASCMPFVATIEAAASGALDADPAWSARPDGDFARIILFDQLARNCFRGTPRAFAFDDAALDISRRLCADDDVVATAHPAMVHFLTSPLIHSETLADHDLCLAVNDALAARAPAVAGMGRPHIVAHRDVIARFGRYPHRNKNMGRENTPEETAWLASDEVPGWARSQG